MVGNQPKMEVEGFVLGGGLPAPWHVEEMTCDGDTNGEPTGMHTLNPRVYNPSGRGLRFGVMNQELSEMKLP